MLLKLKNNIIVKIFVHLFVWLVVLLLPFLLSSEENFSIDEYTRGPWLPIIFSILLFYLNFFLLIDKLLLKKKYFLYFLLNVIIILVILYLLEMIRTLTMPHMPPPPDGPKEISGGPHDDGSPMWGFVFKDLLIITIPLIICIAIEVTRRLLSTEREKNPSSFNLSEFSNGIYYISLHTEDNNMINKKIILMK